jgi:predicted O-methyltransferase YrrM
MQHLPVWRKVLVLFHLLGFASSWIFASTKTHLKLRPILKLSPTQAFAVEPSQEVTTTNEEKSKQASESGESLLSSSSSCMNSSIFGNLRRIRVAGESEDEEDSSVLGAMGVPTYSASGRLADGIVSTTESPRARGLEGALNQGPAFVIDQVLRKEACEEIIQDCEKLGFGNYRSGKNFHGAMQMMVSQELADAVAQRFGRHIDVSQLETLRDEMIQGATGTTVDDEDVRLVFGGLNRRWRIYRYDSSGNETFAPHIDAGFPPSGLSEDGQTLLWDVSDPDGQQIVSRLTVLMYLNDDFVGGETNFYQPISAPKHPSLGSQPTDALIASVRPIAGSFLLFPQGVGEEAVEYARQHWPLHEGSPVLSGRPKYIIRSDALFVTEREKLPLGDELFQYDHLVRQTFLPRSAALDRTFMSHVSSLYNPHMGVENLGPFLYSFIRFTKKRRIVEIGAGYTSPWVLQALKENDDELDRARSLQRNGTCRLLNINWTIPDVVEDFDSEPARLLCIDNCEHPKETATGASAVAKALGLDSYMEFKRGDAFELDLGVNSVDVLWCDFGVGTRMSEFVSSAWESLRPGGFLLCHSTLTNLNTREWLEAARSRDSQEITGIPPDEYVEISLLEPHKRFQNSVSVFQKRKSSTGEKYREPLYSEYA